MDINIPGNLRGQGGVGDAMVQTGQEIQQSGKQIGGFIDNIQKNYDYNDAIKIISDSELAKQKYYMETLQKDDGSDPAAMEKYSKGQEDINKSSESLAGERNNNVLALVKKHNQVRDLELSGAAQQGFYTNMIKRSMVTDQESGHREVGNAFDAQGDLSVNLNNSAEGIYTIGLTRMYGEGNNKTIAQAVIAKSIYDTTIEKLNDPAQVPRIIAAKDQIMGYLNPEQRIHFLKLMQAAGKDATRGGAYAQIYAAYNGDFNAASVALNDPGVQKQYGLTLEDTLYLKNSFQQAAQDQDKANDVKWDKTAKDVFLNLKSMTPGKIDTLVANGDLDFKLGEHFKTELKQTREGGPSDPQTYYRIYTQVKSSAGDPDAILKARQSIFGTGGLSFSDKKSMLAMTEGTEDKYEAQITKGGADYIKNLVMPSQTMISAAKPKEAENYLDAMKTFNEAIITAKKNGEKINAETTNRIAKEVASTYSMTVYDQMDAAKKKMQADKLKAAQKKTGQQKDQFGYTLGDTKIIRGKTYKYIGNDQWQ